MCATLPGMNATLLPAVLLLAVACRPDEADPASVSCGAGTHLEGSACVADVPDTGGDDTADTGEGADTGDTDTAGTDTSDTSADTGVDSGDSGDTSDTNDTSDTSDTGSEDTAGAEPTPGLWAGEYELGTDAAWLEPERAADYLGWSLDVGGDADGDGQDDLVVSAVGADPNGDATGSTYVWTTGVAASAKIEDATLRIDGDTVGDWSGYQALFLPDGDGDGSDEIVVSTVAVACSSTTGSPGSVGVFSGARTGVVDFSDADGLWLSSDATERFGCGMASPGDLDGDGLAELVVGAGGNDEAATNGGSAYIFRDPLAGGTYADAELRLYADVATLGLGDFAGSVGDTDGDGAPEVGVGFTGSLTSGATRGGVYIIGGASNGKMYVEDAASAVVKPESGTGAPTLGGTYANPVAPAGDVNGDGYGDVLIGAPEADDYAGAAYLLSGPLAGDEDLFFATAKITGATRAESVGYAVETAHDVDGDGRDDIAIGAPGYAGHGSNSGAVAIFVDPTGELDFTDATVLALGDQTNWYAGYDLAVSDQTRDGIYDLVVGAVYAPDYGVDAGLVAVLPGGI